MSSGGYYKYHCKYFYTHDCPNWVYCNGHACAMCLAEGREADDTSSASHAASATWPQHQQQQQQQQPPSSSIAEICVPQAFHGTLRYTVMEVIPTDDATGAGPGTYWVLRQKATAPPPIPLMSTIVTSDTPRPVVTAVGMPVQMGF
ncbi:hypothetical protein VTK56DRAFT_3448 [Thermocarpiscus australiensis]